MRVNLITQASGRYQSVAGTMSLSLTIRPAWVSKGTISTRPTALRCCNYFGNRRIVPSPVLQRF